MPYALTNPPKGVFPKKIYKQRKKLALFTYFHYFLGALLWRRDADCEKRDEKGSFFLVDIKIASLSNKYFSESDLSQEGDLLGQISIWNDK